MDGVRPGAVATVGEAMDLGEFLVDRLGKGKGIYALAKLLQRRDGGRVHPLRRRQVIEGSLRGVVAPGEAGTAADLADQFPRWLKQIHHEAELVAVEVVDRGKRLGRIVPVPAQELPDVRPVLLLDGRIVVFLVGAPAGELDLAAHAVPEEVVIDEFGAVVRVHMIA